ncbi:TSUP family transporter [Daejeonella oryzae]|uniref:TSUP family transporter n=1 Tax=Daejeonella oryzae TaxID=1122943 RepID=UPI00047CF498|nr:TSUP family transporter [Daejeonella oryzae]
MNLPKNNGIAEFEETGNQLFPVFLKLNHLHVLLVGAGNVGLEKLSAILANSPQTQITVVAQHVSPEVNELAELYSRLRIVKRSFEENDLDNKDLVIVATDQPLINEMIRQLARHRRLLINVADKPDLCDFYLGSIVKKGDLKLGISTNGKSPTVAKRLKEMLQANLPDEIDDTLQQINKLRIKLNGDFAYKVKELNKATAILVEPVAEQPSSKRMRWLIWSSLVISIAIIAVLFWENNAAFKSYLIDIHPSFYYFLIAGFFFAMIDGAIGMSYGVTSTTFALSMGIPPASASTAVHVSEIMSNGIAGWMHFRMKNVNMRMFYKLVIPGIIGAVSGAYILSSLEHYSHYTRPVVSLYTLILGAVILRKSFHVNKKRTGKKIQKIIPLGFGGGFIDAVGGGGWGSIVLSSLIAGGRNARYALGTVKLSRFFIALMSSLTFITMLNNLHWNALLGLVIGSAIASPLAARLSNRISVKVIMVSVGIIVILASLKNILSTIMNLI